MIKERLEERLRAAGLTPNAASLKAGLSADAIRNILREGSKSPRHVTVSKIAKVLGCRPAYLTGESDIIEPDGADQQASTKALKDTAARAIRFAFERAGVPISEADLVEIQSEYLASIAAPAVTPATAPQNPPHPKKPK